MGKAVARKSSLSGPVSNVAIFSALMFTVPVALFFANSAGYFDGVWQYTIGVPTERSRPVVGGVLAIVVVNIIIGVFISVAFREEDAKPLVKED